MVYFCFNTYSGLTAICSQFSFIGSDPGAVKLLENQDGDKTLGKSIDVLPVEFDPECALAEKWFVVCYNLPFSESICLKWEPY